MMDRYFLAPRKVGRAFSRAAYDYSKYASIQGVILERLLERIDFLNLDCHAILDLGSGLGVGGRRLRRYFHKARVIELDIALGMLKHTDRPTWFNWRRPLKLCGDAHAIPLVDDSVDLVFSNLMLQWCHDLERVFREIWRVLRPGGLLVFSTFGPDTLRELRQSWQQVDKGVHVNAFFDMHDIGEQIAHCGLYDSVLDVEKISIYYPNCIDLMRELKLTGAGNILHSRRKGLTGKQRMQRMIGQYEEWRDEKGLPATYEAIYAHAWKPAHASHPHAKDTGMVIPLEAVRHMLRNEGSADG